MSQIRLLSIDFDGVLHGSTEIRGLNLALLAQIGASHLKQLGLFRLAELLRKLLEEAKADDVVIVVHSSWRLQQWALPLMRELIGPLQKWYQGTTAPHIVSREASIHDCCKRFGSKDFLIIDDAPHEFVLPSSKSRLVVTDPTKGLDDEQVLAPCGNGRSAAMECEHVDRNIFPGQLARPVAPRGRAAMRAQRAGWTWSGSAGCRGKRSRTQARRASAASCGCLAKAALFAMFATELCAAEMEEVRRLAAIASGVCREDRCGRCTEEEADAAVAARQAAVGQGSGGVRRRLAGLLRQDEAGVAGGRLLPASVR